MGVEDRDWYWRDRDRRATELEGSAPLRPWQPSGSFGQWQRQNPLLVIVLGIALGTVVGWIAIAGFAQWRAQTALEQMMRTQQEAARRGQLEMQRASLEATERERRRQALLEQQEASRVQAIRERELARQEATHAAANAAARKERAWAKFYRKPSGCEDAATIECANGFIRAKRAFEEKYARGEL